MSNDDILNAKDNTTSQETSETDNSNEKSREERINVIINELNILINDIRNSRQISDVVVQSQTLNLNQKSASNQGISNDGHPTQSGQAVKGQPPTQEAIQSQSSNTTNVTVNSSLTQADQTLVTLNSIRIELCRLSLDFCEREYIANCVTPLESAMELVSRSSFDLATSVSILTTSPIVPRKKGKLKDTIHTIYTMNEEVEDIYKVLKPRLRKLTEEDNCFKFL